MISAICVFFLRISFFALSFRVPSDECYFYETKLVAFFSYYLFRQSVLSCLCMSRDKVVAVLLVHSVMVK